MKQKGFTLVELIVVIAINLQIRFILTPISNVNPCYIRSNT